MKDFSNCTLPFPPFSSVLRGGELGSKGPTKATKWAAAARKSYMLKHNLLGDS